MSFTALEKAVLTHFVYGESPRLVVLRQQLEAASVADREESGGGLYLSLDIPPRIPRLAGGVFATLDDVAVESTKLESGAGFLLWIGNGRIYRLEGFTFGEPWPRPFDDFAVRYATDGVRDLTRIDDMLIPKPVRL